MYELLIGVIDSQTSFDSWYSIVVTRVCGCYFPSVSLSFYLLLLRFIHLIEYIVSAFSPDLIVCGVSVFFFFSFTFWWSETSLLLCVWFWLWRETASTTTTAVATMTTTGEGGARSSTTVARSFWWLLLLLEMLIADEAAAAFASNTTSSLNWFREVHPADGKVTRFNRTLSTRVVVSSPSGWFLSIDFRFFLAGFNC